MIQVNRYFPTVFVPLQDSLLGGSKTVESIMGKEFFYKVVQANDSQALPCSMFILTHLRAAPS